MTWRKSSFTEQTDCVELAWPATGVAVRDSKHPEGPVLRLPAQGLLALLDTLRA
jgi:Domain of unknown function (DUF397)